MGKAFAVLFMLIAVAFSTVKNTCFAADENLWQAEHLPPAQFTLEELEEVGEGKIFIP